MAALAAETIDLAKVRLSVIVRETPLTDNFLLRIRILCEITWERLSASCV